MARAQALAILAGIECPCRSLTTSDGRRMTAEGGVRLRQWPPPFSRNHPPMPPTTPQGARSSSDDALINENMPPARCKVYRRVSTLCLCPAPSKSLYSPGVALQTSTRRSGKKSETRIRNTLKKGWSMPLTRQQQFFSQSSSLLAYIKKV